ARRAPAVLRARPGTGSARGALAKAPDAVVETAGRRLPSGSRYPGTDRSRRLSYPRIEHRLSKGAEAYDPRLSRLGRLKGSLRGALALTLRNAAPVDRPARRRSPYPPVPAASRPACASSPANGRDRRFSR